MKIICYWQTIARNSDDECLVQATNNKEDTKKRLSIGFE
jgi:hypothetical protein